MKNGKKVSRLRKKYEKELGFDDFRVAIFGSARIKRGDPRYREVKKLAKMLGERGMDVVTGGGPGLMMAANEGHKEGSGKTGAHSIGIGIKLPMEQRFNKHLDVKREFPRFSERLDYFMALSNVIVVAPGGVGTLLEFFYSWQVAQVNHICNTPIILLGKMWPPLIRWLEKYPLKRGFFKREDLGTIFHAKDANEVVKMVDKAHELFKKGDKNFCLNYKKYKLL